ncbi:hypothetical protein ED5_4007 [Enterobacter roggenkampii]|nr:hypothetical protein ED5_4007 [Enterobacter roggenkampii]
MPNAKLALRLLYKRWPKPQTGKAFKNASITINFATQEAL